MNRVDGDFCVVSGNTQVVEPMRQTVAETRQFRNTDIAPPQGSVVFIPFGKEPSIGI